MLLNNAIKKLVERRQLTAAAVRVSAAKCEAATCAFRKLQRFNHVQRRR